MLPNGDIHVMSATTNMSTKLMTIAAILAVAMIAGVFAAITPITAAYADESETETDIKNELRATGSGEAHISQCAENLIESQEGPNDILAGNECTDDDTTITEP
jgi:hypothetical protein